MDLVVRAMQAAARKTKKALAAAEQAATGARQELRDARNWYTAPQISARSTNAIPDGGDDFPGS